MFISNHGYTKDSATYMSEVINIADSGNFVPTVYIEITRKLIDELND
jgi:hypothetical protein